MFHKFPSTPYIEADIHTKRNDKMVLCKTFYTL